MSIDSADSFALPDSIRLELIRRYFSIGGEKEAREIWKAVSDQNDLSNRLSYVEILIGNKKIIEALRMLEAMDPKLLGEAHPNGTRAVKAFITLGKTDSALRVAKKMSDDADDYDQQSALMVIVDQFIKQKSITAATEILSFAFRRTSPIVYEHHVEDSIGASSGSRKEHYLTEISKRYMALGDLDQALKVLIAIDADHPRAKENLALNIAEFAEENAKKLAPDKVQSLVARALKIIEDDDFDYSMTRVRTMCVGALAGIGLKEQAVDMIADQVEKYADDEKEAEALIMFGEIFEKYKMTPSDHLQHVLTAILRAHE